MHRAGDVTSIVWGLAHFAVSEEPALTKNSPVERDTSVDPSIDIGFVIGAKCAIVFSYIEDAHG